MWIKVVGIGPGNRMDLTFRAQQVLQEAEVVLGYRGYLERLGKMLEGKVVHGFGMGEELRRCQESIRFARCGQKVALVSGGDPGIYGMAGLLLEVAIREQVVDAVEVVPGLSAMNAAAAVLGAPLGNDFAVLSLSDYLIGWERIATRLKALSQTDLVLVLYNPGSSLRPHTFMQAVEIIKEHRSLHTPVGVVREVSLPGEQVFLTTLQAVAEYPVDMRTIVMVGNAETYVAFSRFITPRGYRL
jgi:precorrin-3B C17-methyltransferase